jgi:hypothetical protein
VLHAAHPHRCLHVAGTGHDGSLARDADSSAFTVALSQVLEAHPRPFHCVDLTSGSMAMHRTKLMHWFYLLAILCVKELIFMNWPLTLDVPSPS